MGMFDTIAWADDLPFSPEMREIGLDKRDWDFQTKDLDSSMAYYAVQGGQLFIQKYKVEKWIEGDPKGKSISDRIGHLERDLPYLDPVKNTTTIRMYDFRQSVQDKWDCWIEFEVVFKDGKVDSVKLFKFEKESDVPRKVRDKQWRESLEKEAALWRNRFFFHTQPYIFTAHVIRRALYWIADLTYKIANKL